MTLSRNFHFDLRPFSIDQKSEANQLRTGSGIDLLLPDQYLHPGGQGLERILAGACPQDAPLVGLGELGSVLGGVGVGGTFENWKDLIQSAIDKAKVVFVVPSPSEGTHWEITQLISRNALSRTCFVMPGTRYPFKFSNGDEFREHWKVATARCRDELGLSLPAFNEHGLVFRYGEQRETPIIGRLHSSSSRLAREIGVLSRMTSEQMLGKRLSARSEAYGSLFLAFAVGLTSGAGGGAGGIADGDLTESVIFAVILLWPLFYLTRRFLSAAGRKFGKYPKRYFSIGFLALILLVWGGIGFSVATAYGPGSQPIFGMVFMIWGGLGLFISCLTWMISCLFSKHEVLRTPDQTPLSWIERNAILSGKVLLFVALVGLARQALGSS